MKDFFTAIKANDKHIIFCFLTEYTHLSLFDLGGGPTNFANYTFHEKYATAFGVTENELRVDLRPYLQYLADHINKNRKYEDMNLTSLENISSEAD